MHGQPFPPLLQRMCGWGAASATAHESETLPAGKKPKMLNSTKPCTRSAKLPGHDAAAQRNAVACPDLSTAPTHGPDEPLLLDYPGDDAGVNSTPSCLVFRFGAASSMLHVCS